MPRSKQFFTNFSLFVSLPPWFTDSYDNTKYVVGSVIFGEVYTLSLLRSPLLLPELRMMIKVKKYDEALSLEDDNSLYLIQFNSIPTVQTKPPFRGILYLFWV